MRKLTKYILLAITLLLTSFAAISQTFEVKYYLSDFSITQGADSLVTVTSKHRSFFAGDSLAPRLPFLSANILCTQGTTECNPVFYYEKEPIATGVLLNTLPPVVIISDITSTSDYTPQIARTSQSKPYSYNGVGQMMGYSFARIALSPFEYDYDTRTLYFIKSFVITLNEKVSPCKVSAKNGKTIAPRIGNPQMISDLVLNSNELSAMYPNYQSSPFQEIFNEGNYELSDSSSYAGGDTEASQAELYTVDYLIVTTTKLKSAFEKLAQWKKVRGLNPEIITVDNMTPIQIKKQIQNTYNKYNYSDPMWVLLAGDEDNIPVQKCMGLKGDSAASDIYYACFNNDFIDDSFDGSNIDPEVNISRLPVTSLDQANAIIDKIIDYEMWGLNNSYSNTPLFFGVRTFSYIESNYYSNLIMDIIEPNHDNNYFNYCYEVLNNIGYSSQSSVSNRFNSILNSNYGLIHIDSHGSEKTLSGVDQIFGNSYTFYSIRNVETLSNDYPYIIVTNACLTNNFIYKTDQCLSEALINKYSKEGCGKGAIAFFGPSSYGASTRYDAELSGSHLYSAYFIRYLLKKQLSIGEAATAAKVKCNDCIYDNGEYSSMYYRLFKTTNLLGDPELHYYTELSPMIVPVVQKLTNDSVIISLPAGEYNDAVVALYDPNRSNGYFARKKAHAGETISFAITHLKNFTNPPMLQLVVSKDGHAPYVQELYLCKITGNAILNYNQLGIFSLETLPDFYTNIRWKITDYTTSDLGVDLGTLLPQRNYFSLANANELSCNVYYNKIQPQEIYGVEKTKLSAELSFSDIFSGVDYIQPIEGIDVVYLGNFKGSFSQESAGNYPGIPTTTISGQYSEYHRADAPEIEVSDSGVVELPFEPIRMSVRQMKESTSNGVSPDKPIFVYPQGTVTLKSEFFKYLSCGLNTSSFINTNVDFSKCKDGEISFEMNNVNELVPLKFQGPINPIYLNFVSVEFDSPAAVCLEPNNPNNIVMGLYLPDDLRNCRLNFEVYDCTTYSHVHSESAPYSNRYTINYSPVSQHIYIIIIQNEEDGIYIETEFIANF